MLFIALCLHGLARGQTEGYTGFYWFDYQQGKPQTSPVIQGSFDADVSALADGIHTFHYLVAKEGGAISMPVYTYFLKTTSTTSTEQITCLCTIDGELVHHELLPAKGGAIHWSLNVSDIADGLHQVQIDALAADGAMTCSQHSFFVKVPKADTAIRGYYWFDEETDAREAPITHGTFEVDASSLSDGFHQFHYYVLQANGVSSLPSANYFLKTAQVNPDDELTCICTVNDQLRHIEKLSQQGGIIHWNLDMQDLADGVHKIQLQAVTPSGAVSTSYTSYFMRVTSYEDLNEMYCVYSIDGNTLNKRSQVMPNNGCFHFDLDLSELEEGLHYISFMLHSDRGASTNAQTQFFVKTPLGGNGITQYQYWLNDDDINQSTIVILPEKSNPLQLMSLLPVESRPLRSSLFHFDVSSGKPMIYAKNTIHLRFHDVAKRFTDIAKDYVDYSQSQEVNPVGELQASQTFPTIEENGIRWYTMQSAPGDTAAFKLSQPATVQVFAPSGAEVFKTSESASVKWGGIHTWENGTYYLAVHDVTGSKEDMTLEYMHMDKYDVVDWDVHTVGNGGCSTITFKGNGFRDLYAVDLIVAPGDTIHSVNVSHDSDAETAVTFDFTGATLGEYNAVFHFTEEDKHVANVVTVEEAIDIELATDVSFPSSFLRGTSTTYTIKITNKGNMTAYNVPIYTYIQNKSENGISCIEYKGLDLVSFAEAVNIEGLSERDKEIIQSVSDEIGDDWHFIKLKVADDNNPGDSTTVRSSIFLTNIQPNSIKTLTLTISCSEEVFAYITIPPDWKELSYQYLSKSDSKRQKAVSNNYCCYREGVECFADLIASRLDAAAIASSIAAILAKYLGHVEAIPIAKAIDIADCIAGSLNSALKYYGYIHCGLPEANTMENIYRETFNTSKSITGTVISCFGGKIGNIIGGAIGNSSNYGEIMRSILRDCIVPGIPIGTLISSIQCIKKFSKPIPGCPPNPPSPGGGGSMPAPPSDPNDIYGYLSEAGSKFIADSVARVNYTIEFENDTTFATAAAHTIVIKDTLDSRYFDLTKFMPTGVRIGGHEVFLDEADVVTKNNVTSFVKTIDMRPEINAIAQVNGEFNQKNGIAEWRFTSLDPMTMEPTDDLMQGILPVNYNGTSGIGEVMFEVGVKQGKADGTKIDNRAGIVFDYEEAIITPTWTNIVDAVAPSSIVDGLTLLNDSTLRVYADANDARSGVWKYEWYVQHGENAPWWKEGETYDDCFDFHFYEGFDYGFCVVVTDSAGNVEKKELARERIFKSYGPDFDNAVSISPLTASPNVEGQVYDLSGRRHDKPQEGINIIDKKKVLFRRKGK
ncbi:MAG: hypothetical protein IJS63_06505 [Bacteroidaceae bacterium]|nr:hypothetical protein [Bacteroidaceae bacterium]